MAIFVNGVLQDVKVQHIRKTVAFSGAAGNGAVGEVDLFTITGRVLVTWFAAFVTEDLVDAAPTATLEVGTTTNTEEFIAQMVDVDDLNAGDWWVGATSPAQSAQVPAASIDALVSVDIVVTVGSQDVDDGTIVFDIWYTPVTDDGLLVVA